MIAQETGFWVEVNRDTLLAYNYVHVRFSIVNIQGDFIPPSFEDFEVLSGPNTSSQISMVNGEVSQSASYSYILAVGGEGVCTVPSGKLDTGKEILTSEAKLIQVLPNPLHLVEQEKGLMPQRMSPRPSRSQGQDTTVMTEQDSMRMKFKKLKTRKI